MDLDYSYKEKNSPVSRIIFIIFSVMGLILASFVMKNIFAPIQHAIINTPGITEAAKTNVGSFMTSYYGYLTFMFVGLVLGVIVLTFMWFGGKSEVEGL